MKYLRRRGEACVCGFHIFTSRKKICGRYKKFREINLNEENGKKTV